MSILKRQQIIKKSFNNLFHAQGRITFHLDQLTQIMKLQNNAYQIMITIWKQIDIPQPIVAFKWLVLINKFIMDFVIEPVKIMEIIEKVQCKEENDFDQLLNKKLINPYKLYLMKRCQFLPKRGHSIDKMYQLINLIQTGTVFSDILYTLGRYYSRKYPFSIDFNITLGCDLTTIYNQLIKYTPRPASIEILQEFEKLHQKMYIVYYNCYFYKYLKTVVPRWVVTDVQSNNKQIKTPSKNLNSTNQSFSLPNQNTNLPNKHFNLASNKSILQTATSFNKFSAKKIHTEVRDFDMTTSIVIQKSQQNSLKMEESLLLLKSMERVFQALEEV